MSDTKRPQVTGWWNAGHGTWQRHYGQFTLTIRKQGVGYYLLTVVDGGAGEAKSETIHTAPAGTLAGAKVKATEWMATR